MSAYDPRHPRGNKYTLDELRARRDRVYLQVAAGLTPQQKVQGKKQFPSRVQNRITSIGLSRDIQNDLEEVLLHTNYPKVMSLAGELVLNPIWRSIEKETERRLAASFAVDGNTPLRIMPLDIFLIRADDSINRPYLLTYFSDKPVSGWQAFLLPFRLRGPKESNEQRYALNIDDLTAFLGLPEKSVTVDGINGRYAISVKPDPGYSELVAYIFEFCSMKFLYPPYWLSNVDCQMTLEGSVRRFRWFHPEELERDSHAMLVDADVIRSVHYLFSTTIPSIPASVPKGFLHF